MTESRMKAVAREMMEGMTKNFTTDDLKMLIAEANDQIEYLKQALAESNDKCLRSIDMANYLLSMIDEYQKEDERVHKKAVELLSIPIDAEDTAAEMKKCREMCDSISGRVAGVWKEDGLDVNSIRMKLLMIGWILDTPEFGLGAGENLLDLAYAMAKERVLQLEHDAPYEKEEVSG